MTLAQIAAYFWCIDPWRVEAWRTEAPHARRERAGRPSLVRRERAIRTAAHAAHAFHRERC